MLEQTYLKKTKFVSFGKVKGSTDLCQKLQWADENMAPKPVVMKNIGENGEKCALIWDKHHYSDLTTANTFFATKRLWRKHRNQDVYRVWDFQLDFECNVFIPKSILKELVFLPFTALEDGRPCCFEGDPFHDIKETSNSFFITNNDGIAAEETKVVENNYSSDEGSPIPPPRPYNLSRKKIDFTMEDLQNDVEDENGDNSFEGQALPSTSSMKCQPKRNCKIKQNLVVNQETETPKDGSDYDKSIGEEQGKSSSESDSDWYDYPEDNNYVVQYCSSPERPFSSRDQYHSGEEMENWNE